MKVVKWISGYTLEKMSPNDVKPHGSIRIVVISDTHGKINQLNIPDGDILIDCGDLTFKGSKMHIQEYSTKINSLPHKHKIIIGGNHDLCLDEERRHILELMHKDELKDFSYAEAMGMLKNCIYLKSTGISLYGYNIYGSPYTPKLSKYAFSKNSDQLKQEWSQIPSNTDILVTHSPPKYIRDLSIHMVNGGCKFLLDEVVNRVKPKYHLFGHIHEQYGVENYEGICFINCSSCNKMRNIANAPIVIDVPNLDKNNKV